MLVKCDARLAQWGQSIEILISANCRVGSRSLSCKVKCISSASTCLVDVQPDCGGGADVHIQNQRVALGLQVVTQLLAQLLPWLLHESCTQDAISHPVSQSVKFAMLLCGMCKR